MPHRLLSYARALVDRVASRRLCRDTALLVSWLVLVSVGSTTSAVALTGGPSALGSSHTVRDFVRFSPVGAVFRGPVSAGHHFCSASVVYSPGGDLIVTAAHCMSDGTQDLYFAPGYHDGTAPYGVWQLDRVTVDPHWTGSQDPDYDVAFATLEPLDGRQVQEVVGGYFLGVSHAASGTVRLTGYPSSADAPLTCVNQISAFTPTQLRIACSAYTGGTSGSPWVTRDHEVVGVIGGYQQGGDTPDVSYSARFGDGVATLYQRALSAV